MNSSESSLDIETSLKLIVQIPLTNTNHSDPLFFVAAIIYKINALN